MLRSELMVPGLTLARMVDVVGPQWQWVGDPTPIGRWDWTDDGWYWVSEDPWSCACYHYGSWERGYPGREQEAPKPSGFPRRETKRPGHDKDKARP